MPKSYNSHLIVKWVDRIVEDVNLYYHLVQWQISLEKAFISSYGSLLNKEKTKIPMSMFKFLDMPTIVL